jgi:hypothetical protein
MKSGDRVTLNTEFMAASLRQYCRERGIVEQVGTVALVNQNRVRVEWPEQRYTGWFDADALTVEVVQPGLFASAGTGTEFTQREYTFDKPQPAKRGTSR